MAYDLEAHLGTLGVSLESFVSEIGRMSEESEQVIGDLKLTEAAYMSSMFNEGTPIVGDYLRLMMALRSTFVHPLLADLGTGDCMIPCVAAAMGIEGVGLELPADHPFPYGHMPGFLEGLSRVHSRKIDRCRAVMDKFQERGWLRSPVTFVQGDAFQESTYAFLRHGLESVDAFYIWPGARCFKKALSLFDQSPNPSAILIAKSSAEFGTYNPEIGRPYHDLGNGLYLFAKDPSIAHTFLAAYATA